MAWFAYPRCSSSVFGRSGDEVEMNGTLGALNQFTPTYELWAVRREGWLPAFLGMKRCEGDRETTSRVEV